MATQQGNHRRRLAWGIGAVLALIVVLNLVLMVWWTQAPDPITPDSVKARYATSAQSQPTGFYTTATTIALIDNLLEKSGGYLSNDVMPPGLLMDNMPSWEYGVLNQVRDAARIIRNDLSRSQSQSVEIESVAQADVKLHMDATSWMFPAAESSYRKGADQLEAYLTGLGNPAQGDEQFYARADNLAAWLGLVEKRLGSLSQRLAASVGQKRINTDLSGDAAARQSTRSAEEMEVKTPWSEIDDVFYEARGSSYALIALLKAAERDFADVLAKKNAAPTLKQIIRELEATQRPIRSPMILNGSGFGVFTNHSLIMASYIARANAGVIDLRELLEQG